VPVRARERLDQCGEAVVLGRGECHRLVVIDRRHIGDGDGGRANRLPFVFRVAVANAKNMSTASSMSRAHRVPPGSLEICWSTKPVVIAVQRSRKRSASKPAARIRARAFSRWSTASAYDAGDGSKSGMT